jgi:hypothetical protein
MLTVKIQIKSVYGENKAYPVNTTGELFASIANTKTLTRSTLAMVLAMGCTIEEIDRHGNVSRRYDNKAGCVHAQSLLPQVA